MQVLENREKLISPYAQLITAVFVIVLKKKFAHKSIHTLPSCLSKIVNFD